MSVPIRQLMIASSRYNIKSPYTMIPKGIVFHNTAGRASAMQEAVAKNGNNKQSSIHIFVDEKEAVQCLPFNRNSWHAHDGGNGYANRNLISLEVCRSMSDLETFKQAEKNAFEICAQILNGLGLTADKNTVRWHKEFAATACPHRSAELGARSRVIQEIQNYMGATGAQPPTANIPPVTPGSIWKKGERLIFSTGYRSSMDPAEKALHVAKKQISTDRGIVGDILQNGARNPIKMVSAKDGKTPICWCNDGDIRGRW